MLRSRSIAVSMTIGAVLLASAGCSSNSAEPSASASVTAAIATPASLRPDVEAKLQAVLDGIVATFNAPGIQAGVWTDDGQWIGTAGVAEKGTSRQITTADHTRIGSVTKTMTATVILQLIDEGKISFDDLLDTYVPGMPNGDSITIKNLLEMQSGIPPYTLPTTSVVKKYSSDPTQPFTAQELVNSVKKMPPMFKPGTQFFYSNTNYILLGMVIEKVTGQSIAQNFQQRLLTPLSMNQTSAPGTSTDMPEPFLSGISEQADPQGKVKDATNWNPSFALTAGEVISTLDDLHKWGVALGTGEGILTPEAQQIRMESLNPTVAPNTADRSYGMGIARADGWLGHTGSIPGYNTVVYYEPDSRTTIVAMVNSDIPNGTKKNPIAPASAAFQGLAQVVDSAQ